MYMHPLLIEAKNDDVNAFNVRIIYYAIIKLKNINIEKAYV